MGPLIDGPLHPSHGFSHANYYFINPWMKLKVLSLSLSFRETIHKVLCCFQPSMEKALSSLNVSHQRFALDIDLSHTYPIRGFCLLSVALVATFVELSP